MGWIVCIALACTESETGDNGTDPTPTPAASPTPTPSSTPTPTPIPGLTPIPDDGSRYDCSGSVGTVADYSADYVWELVESGFDYPISVTAAEGDSSRLYVLERDGRVELVKDGSKTATPFLTIPNVTTGFELGLLGMALHPNYRINGLFYVHYNRDSDEPGFSWESVIAEYRRSASNLDMADATPIRELLVIQQPASNHNAGALVFGNDGYLYVPMGDGGARAANSQDPNDIGGQTNWYGKMLRLDVDGVGITNPSIAPGGFPSEVWATGLRNPWRVAVDPCTGDLYIGDVGQIAWEEINVEPMAMGGRNYGWPDMEGFDCDIADCSAFTAPAVVHQNIGANPRWRSILAGQVYRGSSLPELRGRFFYADVGADEVATFKWNGTTATEQDANVDIPTSEPTSLSGPTSMTLRGDGELYLTEGNRGNLYRLERQ